MGSRPPIEGLGRTQGRVLVSVSVFERDMLTTWPETRPPDLIFVRFAKSASASACLEWSFLTCFGFLYFGGLFGRPLMSTIFRKRVLPDQNADPRSSAQFLK